MRTQPLIVSHFNLIETLPDDLLKRMLNKFVDYRAQLVLTITCKRMYNFTSPITYHSAAKQAPRALLHIRRLLDDLNEYGMRVFKMRMVIASSDANLWNQLKYVNRKHQALIQELANLECKLAPLFRLLILNQEYKMHLPNLDSSKKQLSRVTNMICSFGMDVQELEDVVQIGESESDPEDY